MLHRPSLLHAHGTDLGYGCGRALTWTLLVALLANPLFGQVNAKQDYPTQFVEKLRERGWHDVVLDYLERAEEDPLATGEFLADRDYQLAVTRAALARQTVGEKERQSLLQQATQGFQRFAGEHPDSPHYFDALSQASQLLAEQGFATLNQADKLPDDATNEQQATRKKARQIIDEAIAAIGQLLENVDLRINSLPRGAALQADKEGSALKQDLLSKQAEGRFLSANLVFERSRTFPKDSSEFRDALDTAAIGFKKLQKDYENKLVGSYAILYEGRCYQNAGEFNKALDTYNELVSQPVGQADFRKLIARAIRHRAECFLAKDEANEAINESSQWLDQSSRDEANQPEWLAVAFRLADAYMAKSAKNDGNASEHRTEARRLYREVSRHPGEFQDSARAALALSEGNNAKPVEVKNFADALAAGKTALERMNSAELAAKLAMNNNPEGVESLRDQATSQRSAALNYLEQAAKLIDGKTPVDDAVAARYYLCWLYWENGRTLEAAQLGQQIAEQHSDHQLAPNAAKVALAAYERLYVEAKKENVPDVQLWSDKLRSIAELIVDRWNDADVAVMATNLLISLALAEQKFDEAEALLAKLPERAQPAAGLSLGGALWSQYLKQTAGKTGFPAPEVLAIKNRAAKLLAAGYETLAGSRDITPAQTAGILYYVQVLLANDQPQKAIEVLENKRTGPLAVAERGSSQPTDNAFAVETFKAALRAFVSVDPPRTDDAVAMMQRLEAATGDSPDAQKQLVGIYVSLGIQLKQQVESLSATGHHEKARSVAAAYASLLERVARQSNSQSWDVQNWLAEASFQLGSGLNDSEADHYLEQAENAYRGLLETATKDSEFAPSELAVLAVRKKLAEVLQTRGKYPEAIDELIAILTVKPNMLELQQSTAAAIQAWGIASKDVKIIEEAIRGSRPQANMKNLVWGWLQLARIAEYAQRRDEKAGNAEAAAKYQEIYFIARYEAARARLEAAKLATGESRNQQSATVRQSIAALKQLYPNLGGPAWQTKFEALAKSAEALATEAGQ